MAKRKISFKPEGETDEIQFIWGSSCGRQKTPSIGVNLPDEKWGARCSVMTHRQVDDLIKFLTYWQKKFQR